MALRKGCYFVNIAEALNQPDGSQIDEYEADGIHMQPVGYTAWCNYLATHTAWDRRNTYAGENPLYILGQLMPPAPLCGINNISTTNALPAPVLPWGQGGAFCSICIEKNGGIFRGIKSFFV